MSQHLPDGSKDDTYQPVGSALWTCEDCGLPIPVTVGIKTYLDENGDRLFDTDADLSDLWMHHWLVHEGICGEVPDDG